MARGSWQQSRELTKVSWRILRHNRYLVWFPVIGMLLALIPIVVFWAPAAYFFVNDQEWVGVAFVLVGAFVSQVVITISSAGLIATADAELHGRDSSVGEGFQKAFARFGPLAAWALVSTIVGLLLSSANNGKGGAAAVVLKSVFAAAAGVLWSLITFFVLPFIMIQQVSMLTAIKESAGLFRQRWGTQLAGGVRIGGLVIALFVIPGILAIIAGVAIALLNPQAVAALASGALLVVLGAIVFMFGALIAGALRGIFSVALFHFAKDGEVVGGFTEEQLAGAVRIKG